MPCGDRYVTIEILEIESGMNKSKSLLIIPKISSIVWPSAVISFPLAC